MSHTKFGPDRFSRFDVYWIQTDRQTDKPNLYIDKNYLGTISEPRKLNCLELSRQLYLNQRNQTKNCGTGRRNFNHTYAVTKQIV